MTTVFVNGTMPLLLGVHYYIKNKPWNTQDVCILESLQNLPKGIKLYNSTMLWREQHVHQHYRINVSLLKIHIIVYFFVNLFTDYKIFIPSTSRKK